MARAKKIKIGTVGVDAGMLYLGDPCYVIDAALGKKPWGEFLDDTYKSQPDGSNALWWSVEGTLPNPANDEAAEALVLWHALKELAS